MDPDHAQATSDATDPHAPDAEQAEEPKEAVPEPADPNSDGIVGIAVVESAPAGVPLGPVSYLLCPRGMAVTPFVATDDGDAAAATAPVAVLCFSTETLATGTSDGKLCRLTLASVAVAPDDDGASAALGCGARPGQEDAPTPAAVPDAVAARADAAPTDTPDAIPAVPDAVASPADATPTDTPDAIPAVPAVPPGGVQPETADPVPDRAADGRSDGPPTPSVQRGDLVIVAEHRALLYLLMHGVPTQAQTQATAPLPGTADTQD